MSRLIKHLKQNVGWWSWLGIQYTDDHWLDHTLHCKVCAVPICALRFTVFPLFQGFMGIKRRISNA